MLNTILLEAGIDPENARLIRHKDKSDKKVKSPYEIWLDDRPKFELYQATQRFLNREKLNAPFWVFHEGSQRRIRQP